MGQLTTASFTAYNPANAASISAGPFALYTVSLNSLNPTQINEGYTEVNIKAAGFDDLTSLAAVESALLSYIEPVVIGPGGQLYLLDGHHTLTALADSVWGSSNPTVYVNVVANYSNLTTAQFWSTLQSNNLLLPVNNGTTFTLNTTTGAPISNYNLTDLINNPYRGLEYSILKNKSSTLFTTTGNITGAVGASTPGLDKMTGYYSDFIEAQAYQNALGGLGLPYLSPGDIALASQWNLTGSNTTTLPGYGTVSVYQLPGFILSQNIVVSTTISNTTLAGGTLDGNGTFTGITSVQFGAVTLGTVQSGLVLQLGADSKHTVTLSGTNTYTGGTSLLAGTLIITSDAALGAAPGTFTYNANAIAASVEAANGIIFNGLTEGNPTLQIGTTAGNGTTSTFTTARPIAIDGEVATLNPDGYVVTLTGQIVSLGGDNVGLSNATGEGDFTINDTNKTPVGVVVLAPTGGSNANFYGNWIITAGTLRVSSDAALGSTTLAAANLGQIDLNGGTLQAGASFNSARSLFLGGGSTYDTNGYTTSWSGTFSDTQRTLTVTNSSTTTAGAVTFGSFVVAATATLSLAATSKGETVTFTNGVTRSGNATLLLSSASLGNAGAQVFSGTAPTLTNGIVAPWIIADSTGSASTNPYSFVTYSGTRGFVAATFTKTGNTATTGLAASTASDVVEETGGTSTTPTTTTLTADASAYALRIDDYETVVATGHTITLGNGSGQAGLILSAGNITGGTLAFGAAEAVISQKGTSTVTAALTGSGGLTLQGSGTLNLNGGATETGAVNIDSGTLVLGAANTLAGDAAGVWLSNVKTSPSFAALTFATNQSFAALNSAGSNSAITFNSGATLTIGDANNESSTLSSSITENSASSTGNQGVVGAITKNGTGLVDISGASTGAVDLLVGSTIVVNAGQLRVQAKEFSSNPGGASPTVTNGTSNTAFTLASGAELQFAENGGDTFAGTITGAGTVRLLTGTLKLTSTTDTYSGGTFVEIGATLDLTTANVSSGNANITDAGGIVDFDQATNGTYSGVISDGQLLGTGPTHAGTLIKDDSTGANGGNVTLTQAQTFTGATYVEAGSITLSAANALATSAGVVLGRVGQAATASLILNANEQLAALTNDSGSTTSVVLNGHALTLAPASGTGSSFGGTIADGSTAGGTLVVNGAGTVTLSGTNTFTGGTTLDQGTLELGSAQAAGTGAITFAGGAGATLEIDSGVSIANTIAGFATGDTIDLAGVAFSSTGGGAVLNANGTLTVSEGSVTDTFTLANASSYAGDAFRVASDGNGGTAITLVTQSLPTLSVNGGVAYVNIAGESAVAFTVGNLASGDTGTVTFTDSQGHTVSVAVSAAQTRYTANFTGLADGPVTARLAIAGQGYGATGNAVTLIATAPGAPAALADAGIANGYVNAANDTAAQALTGTAQANATVTVYDNGAQLGTTTANAAGAWSLTLGTLADGTHSLTATATDAAGNTGTASSALAFTVDTVFPGAPTGLADAGIVNGTVNAANDTATQALTGSAEANATVTVYDNGTQLGAISADATGAWSYTLGTLADGAHSLTATATDAAGNTGAASSALAFAVDTAIPDAPTALADAGIANGYVNAANDTATQALTGSAQANAAVTVYDNGTQIGTTSADATGAWSYTLGTLADGAHSLTATATDAVGNTGTASSALAFTVDTAIPAAPTGLADANIINGYVNAANDTATQVLTGSAEANATVTVYDNGTQIGTASADATGAWSLTLGVLADGAYSLTATATDAAGNTSAASSALAFAVDTSIPVPPTIIDSAVSGGYVNAARNVVGQSLRGYARAGATVTITENGTLLGTTTADATRAWSLPINVLADGTYTFTATATSLAGNVSGTSTYSFTVLATPPQAPTALADAAIVSGVVNAANDISSQVLTGSAAAGSVVTIYNNGIRLGKVTAAADGTFSYTLGKLANGTYSLTATATDVAGNVSATSTALGFTVNTTAPVLPTQLADSANISGVVNAARDTAAQTLTGKAPANTLVSVYANGTLFATTTATAAGTWSVPLGVLADGTYSFTATATNSVGNVSPVSNALNFKVVTTAPVAPTGLADAGVINGYVNVANDSATQALTGTAPAGATVTVYDGTRKLGTTIALSNGKWSFTLGHLANGSHSLTATATDGYGNVSAASAALGFTVLGTAPAAPVSLAVAGLSGGFVNAAHDTGTLALTGKAKAGELVTVFNNGQVIGTAVAQSTGKFSLTLGVLANGSYTLTATATDAAGNISGASTPLAFAVNTTQPVATVTSFGWNAATGTLTLGGTDAEAGATIAVTSGTQTGTTTTSGTAWSSTISPSTTTGVAALKISASDAAGNKSTTTALVNVKPNAVFGTGTAAATVLVLPGDQITVGSAADTFLFGSAFGKDTITGFVTSGSNADVLAFSHSSFADWAHVLGATTQVGSDLKITLDASDVITLKNVALASFTSANVRIV